MNLSNDEQVVHILLRGGVGVMPTDTVYGLVALASNAEAVDRIHELKHREGKPGTVIAASAEQLLSLNLSSRDIMAAAPLWPSALSIILKPEADTLPHLHQGLGDFPVRIPADDRLNALLLLTGPLATSSANTAGQAPANTAHEAWKIFGDMVDFYVDGGDLSGRLPSTVARVTDHGIEVLRQGAFTVPLESRA
ncbi:MAG TPA: L-threonylcarbamoyladenylate synthase [Candidatus Saccharimonadales bacterium]|nr:L-threonylcarbamoyladenylate synthase [Candidatus Saccharimonadales bacterium]